MFIYIHTYLYIYMYMLHVCNESIRRAAVWAQATLSLRQLPSPSQRNLPLRRNLTSRRKLPSRRTCPRGSSCLRGGIRSRSGSADLRHEHDQLRRCSHLVTNPLGALCTSGADRFGHLRPGVDVHGSAHEHPC